MTRRRARWGPGRFVGWGVLVLLGGCGDGPSSVAPAPARGTIVVTFNTGTSEAMGHDAPPDDGYGSAQAELSDQWYGDGLAWLPVVEDARRFLEAVDPDLVAFQEIFYSGDCEQIPSEARIGFVCESWQPGDPTVAQTVLGDGWQVACNLGKPDKCAAVNRRFGTFRGCGADLCLDGLAGARVEGCGDGSRIGRAVVDLVEGGTLTVVAVHGTSGIAQEDQDCRVAQVRQVFEDLGLGDGEPAANGERNIILGDFNTDPGRMADFDESAQLWNEHVGPDARFHFVSDVGPSAPPSYANLYDIDHVVSDGYGGSCWTAGVTAGHPPVSAVRYFDHAPVVCDVQPR